VPLIVLLYTKVKVPNGVLVWALNISNRCISIILIVLVSSNSTSDSININTSISDSDSTNVSK